MKIEALQKEQRDGFCECLTKSHSYLKQLTATQTCLISRMRRQ